MFIPEYISVSEKDEYDYVVFRVEDKNFFVKKPLTFRKYKSVLGRIMQYISSKF